LQDCVIDLSGSKSQIKIPLFDALPPAVFVRGVSGGTLQQVITRLNVLHMLSMLGVQIYNDVKAIERTVDKAMTSFLLHLHGVSTPFTWVSESRAQAEAIRQTVAQNNQQLVIKPLFGSQGLGVRKLLANEPLPVPMQQFVDGVYYFQQLIETTEVPHDYRVFVINGNVVAAMKRIGSSWVNNVAAGGRCEAVNINSTMEKLALESASALDIDYCGVDIIQAASGKYYVLEVNSIPAWKGLQSVTELNVAQLLADDFLSKI
jgi:RimK family alpha-L-glutamate ligase